MAVERRFLIASSFARLIQREREPGRRIVAGYFGPGLRGTQLLRVEREQERAALVLVSRDGEGGAAEESADVPLAHAEALIEAAAGTVVFDRILMPLGRDVEAVLDRYVVPRGVDLLTVTINSAPQAFAPQVWFGPEVTGDPAFESSGFALHGKPDFDEVEVTNAALGALLDTLEGNRPYHLRQTSDRQKHMVVSEGRMDHISDEPPSAEAEPPDLRTDNTFGLIEGIARLAQSRATDDRQST